MSAHDITADDLHRQRGKLIDAFASADELIEAAVAQGLTTGPLDVTIAERLAIRLLVKRFGWVMVSPGNLIRHRQ